MRPHPATPLIALVAVLSLAACSKPAATGGDSSASRTSLGGVAPIAGNTENACLHDIKPADVADMLGTTGVTEQDVPTNAEACEYHGPGLTTVMIDVRSGDEVDDAWKLVMGLENNNMTPVPGVGDKAMRNHDGSGLMARKGQFFCHVATIALNHKPNADPTLDYEDAAIKKSAALCATIFAKRHA